MGKREFKGKLLAVSTRRVRLPNGFLADLDVVEHMGAALIIPVLSRDKLIMLRQYRPVIKSYLYELPAGTRDRNETTRACALREIVEETGYAAGKLTRLGMIYPVPGYSTEKIDIYKATNLRRTKVMPEQDEVIESIVMGRRQVLRLFKTGRIVDAKTICALAFIGWLK
jgi:ADP-ribose pyrophosphatase